jgi:cytochrome P450
MTQAAAPTEPVRTIPSHVPPELVVDLDFYSLPDGEVDPHTAWLAFTEAAKGKGPLVWSPYSGGHWVATVPADIARFQRDNKNFGSSINTVPDRGGPRLVPLEAEPPNHAPYRNNVIPFFTGQMLRDLEPRVRALAIQLVEGLQPQGECNFIHDFALQYPVTIVLQILGLPTEDGVKLNEITDRLARHPDAAEKGRAYQEMVTYLDGHIRDRVEHPRDDAITAITRAQIHGRPYTHEEMLSTVTLLTFGGVDSVAMHLSFIALYLARHPEQRAYVRANLVNLDHVAVEFARRFPIANMMRRLNNDYVHEGVTMKAGDMVSIAAPLYNLNEAVFPHASEVDFARPAHQTHLTFGSGPHTCVGAALARMEVVIFLQEWLKRIPDFEVKTDKPARLRASATTAVDQLWLQWPVK